MEPTQFGTRPEDARDLDGKSAATFASGFAALADPTRVRVLHAVATTASGKRTMGALAARLRMSQATCAHHVRKLADVGFVNVQKVGTTSLVSINPGCCRGLSHTAATVMGAFDATPCCPGNLPANVVVRAIRPDDVPAANRIYADGIEGRNATFETSPPTDEQFTEKWLPGHIWVAEVRDAQDDRLVGWSAVSQVSQRSCYRGVGESSVYVRGDAQGLGVGKALLHKQVTEADADGMWTLQASIFPENPASIALHHSVGYRTLAVRSRIAQLDGVWRDTVLMERKVGEHPRGEASAS